MSYYLKFNSNGSALISTLILLALASSLLILFINMGQKNQLQINQYQKRHSLLMQIHAVEDFAINILKIDQQNSPQITSMNENWGQKIPIFPIGSYRVSLNIEDLQSKLNVNGLLQNESSQGRESSAINYIQLERMISLFDALDINQEIIYALIDWIDYDAETTSSAGAEDDYYLSQQPAYRAANNNIETLDEILLIRGFNKKILEKLRPHLVAIPSQHRININTINKETLRNLHPMIGLINSEKIIRQREKTPFKNVKEFALYLSYDLRLSDQTVNEISSMLSTNSENFRINGMIAISKHKLNFSTDIRLNVESMNYIKNNRLIKKIELM